MDTRLTELETRICFMDDLLDKLDQVVIRQQNQIDRLTREVQFLRQQAPNEDTGHRSNLRDELPPHY